MKKKIASPLLSAFVIPGLGQLANGQVVKGSLLLASIAFVVILSFFFIFQTLVTALNSIPDPQPDARLVQGLLEKVQVADNTLLTVLGVLFCALWLYSVIDAFIYGAKRDKDQE